MQGRVVLLLGVPLTALFVRERGRVDLQEAVVESGVSVREGLRSRPFWLLVGTLFLSSIAVNGAITHLPAILSDRHFSDAQGALAVSILGGMSLAGRLVTGSLLDRFFGPWISFGLLVLAAGGILLLASAGTAAEAFCAAGMIGLGLGGEADVTPYLLTRYFGLRSFSTLYGFAWTAYALAGALGPVVMGRVFDVTGSYETLLGLVEWQSIPHSLVSGVIP